MLLESSNVTRIDYMGVDSSFTGGAFEYEMTSLVPNTNFTVTMIMENPYGTFESDNYSFTTKDDTPFMKSFTTNPEQHKVQFSYNINEVDGDIVSKIYLKYKNNEDADYIRVNLDNTTNSTSNWNIDNQSVYLNNIVQGPEYEYILYYENEWNTHTYTHYDTKQVEYKVGDIKFGGVIVYIDATGYHGRVVAESASWSGNLFWSTDFSSVGSNDETTSGGGCPTCQTDYDGSDNTARILNYYSKSSERSPAADYANNLSISGFDDWYIPVLNEIVFIEDTIDISSVKVWSSIEAGTNQAWYCTHYAGHSHNNTSKKLPNVIVIPVRKF